MTTDSEISALVDELVSGSSKTFKYDNSFASAYGHGDVGDIIISLTDSTGCYSKGNHATEQVGTDAEFTLKVAYQPGTNDERNTNLHIPNSVYHNGNGSPGDAVPKTENNMTSSNHHIITVFAKGFQITKKNMAFSESLIGAEFQLYRTARSGETQNLYEINGENYYPVETIEMSESSVGTVAAVETLKSGEKYYLVETKSPSGYMPLGDPIPVTLTITNSYTSKPAGPTGTVLPTAGLYDWTQTAMLTLNTSSSFVKRIDAQGQDVADADEVSPSAENETVYYAVANMPAYNLPSAGGPGTYLFTIIGVAIGTTALLLLSGDKRKGLWRKLGMTEDYF